MKSAEIHGAAAGCPSHAFLTRKGWEFHFLRRGEFPLRTINPPSFPYRYYIAGLLALSIAAKSREKVTR
jgi:hypothetical protein